MADTQNISAKHFRQPVLLALGEFTGNTTMEVSLDQLYPKVFERMGITDLSGFKENNGKPMPYRWTQWAAKDLAKQGLIEHKDKGVLALTPAGLMALENATPIPDVEGTDLLEEDGPPPEAQSLPVGSGNDPDLHTDPYIRELVARQTKCFGSYSDQAPTCSSCPARRICINATALVFTKIALELAKEDEEAAKTKAAPPKPAPKPAAPPTSGGSSSGGTAAPKKAPPGPADLPPQASEAQLLKLDLDKAQEIEAQATAVCKACQKNVERGSKIRWLRNTSAGGKGAALFHIDCYNKLLQKKQQQGTQP
jgi:hypothetical protein